VAATDGSSMAQGNTPAAGGRGAGSGGSLPARLQKNEVKQGLVEAVARCGSAVLSGNDVVIVWGASLMGLLDGGGLPLFKWLRVSSSVRW
jgi:hypothetical protein